MKIKLSNNLFISKNSSPLIVAEISANQDIIILGGLVGTQWKEAERVLFESHFEGCTSRTKRLHSARAKTCGEDHATPY